MSLKLVTAPTDEPVSLAEAKLHLRVDISEDDEIIRSYINTARVDVETLSLHKLLTQTWDLFLDEFPATSEIELPFPPLQSVTGIYYTAEGASEATYVSANYIVDTNSIPGRIVLKSTSSWPSDVLEVINGVRIRFVCGFGDTGADVDPRAIQAMQLLVGHYYENREAVFMGRTSPVLLPMGVTALCNDLRNQVRRF